MVQRTRKKPVEKKKEEVELKPIQPIKSVVVAARTPPVLKWKVLFGGITLLDRRSFTKGQTFEALDSEVPQAFRDGVQLLTPVKEIQVVPPQIKYSLREIVPTVEEMDADGYEQLYDVVDINDKIISQQPVTKEKGDVFLAALNQ